MKFEDLHKGGAVTAMYHYVRDNEKEGTPNLKSLDFKKFQQQLDWLCKNFEPLSFQVYNDCIKNSKAFPNKTFMLTFDDGLKDHYSHVFTELRQRKLWGFFFVNSKVYLEKEPLEVHMTHFILDKIGSENFNKKIIRGLEDFKIKVEDFQLEGVYRYDDLQYAVIKKIMNYLLPFSIRDQILDKIFFENFEDKSQFIKDTYANEKELKEMATGGMVIGSHTHAHRVLSRLTAFEQHEDLKKAEIT